MNLNLSSLSIDDSYDMEIDSVSSLEFINGKDVNNHAYQPKEVDDEDDDDMDTRSLETLKLSPRKCSTPEQETRKESEYEVDEEHSSFVSALSHTLFSPTSVGANYALKMLPAPPTHEDSFMEKSLVRHINSFSNSDISLFEDEFVYNPRTKKYDEVNREILNQSNASVDTINSRVLPNDSMNMLNTPEKTVIHHHHYYYSPNVTNVDGSLVSYQTAHEILPLPSPWEKSFQAVPSKNYSYLISTYLQLFMNFIISFYGIYLIYNIIKTIKKDIESKLVAQSTNLLIEIANCRKNYVENNCSPDLIVPALEKPCEYWLKCMNQDTENVGNKSSISAETLGVILNSLIEPLGFKFFLVFFSFIGFIFGLNFGFGFIRAKSFYNYQRKDQ
ncbi:hypothetical protein CLIB1444_06S03268 [[Candida] jaroonii]|uniref:Uncharacterized protein n=1 Tax=[Candida] jaroonii TaxID=467808 RepID=A0ACA9YAM9_9ASCO|nr:hypothetical protein CLIB1444_06S03268 [[Candida] jaroonii]